MSELQHIDVLLVEDSARDGEMTLRALKRSHHLLRTAWVRDGAAALDFLYARGEFTTRRAAPLPKLVLLDLKMPKVDGIEVLRQLKADNTMRQIPVVVMTSSNEECDVVESYRLGVNSYIVKPVEFDTFSATVARIGLYWVLENRVPG